MTICLFVYVNSIIVVIVVKVYVDHVKGTRKSTCPILILILLKLFVSRVIKNWTSRKCGVGVV